MLIDPAMEALIDSAAPFSAMSRAMNLFLGSDTLRRGMPGDDDEPLSGKRRRGKHHERILTDFHSSNLNCEDGRVGCF